MSDRTPSNLLKYSLVLTTTLAVIGTSTVADAYNRRAKLPSIEVHLEVLQSLRAQAAPQRRTPAQQPANRQQMVAQQQPAIPFGRPSKPIIQPVPQVQQAPVQVARQQQQPVQQPQMRATVQQSVQQPVVQPAPQPVFIEPQPQPQVAQATVAPTPKTINGKAVSQFEPSGEPTIASPRRVPAQQPVVVPRPAPVPAATASRPEVKSYATYQPAETSNEPVAPEFTPRLVDMPLRRPVNNPVIDEVIPAAKPAVQVAAKEDAPAIKESVAPAALTPVDAPEPEKAAPKPEKQIAQEAPQEAPALLAMDAQEPLPWEGESKMASLAEIETEVEVETEAEAEVEAELIALPKPEKITPMLAEAEPVSEPVPEPEAPPMVEEPIEEEMTLAELPPMDKPEADMPVALAEPSAMDEEQAPLSLPPLPGMEQQDSPLVEEMPEEISPEPELAELPEEGLAEVEVDAETEIEIPEEEPQFAELTPMEELQEPEAEEAPELVELPDADAVEDELASLEPLPELEEMPEEVAPEKTEVDAELDVAVEAEADSDEVAALAPPPPMKKPAKKEQGMFAGLSAKVASMLGSDDDAEESATLAKDELELPPLPKGAQPMTSDTATPELTDEPELASLGSLDDEAEEKSEPADFGLPPLPTADVGEVPVATAPNRALPSLNAIVSDERREELTQVERRAQAKAEAEQKAQAEAEAEAEAEVEQEALEELPPIEENVVTAKQDEAAPAQEMQLASLDDEVEQKIETAPKEDALAAPEIGYDDANRKQVRLFYGRDDTEVQSNMHSALDELAEELKNNERAKIKIEAYAGTKLDDKTTSSRVSLSRVLALRAYFIDAGVDTERVIVASMGNESGRGPAERADLTVE